MSWLYAKCVLSLDGFAGGFRWRLGFKFVLWVVVRWCGHALKKSWCGRDCAETLDWCTVGLRFGFESSRFAIYWAVCAVLCYDAAFGGHFLCGFIGVRTM